MVDEIVELSEWPQPTAGAPEPTIVADDWSLWVRYFARGDDIVIIYFPAVTSVLFGEPNDEALHGHPLYRLGLKLYSIHEVRNSSRILALERQNAVHSSHNTAEYLRGRKHYVFTFHDSTLEVVAIENERWSPQIEVFKDEREAKNRWRAAIG